MIMYTPESNNIVVVPEHQIRFAASILGVSEPDNNFFRILEFVDTYKSAEMTPIILMNTDNMGVCVVALETYMKKLH